MWVFSSTADIVGSARDLLTQNLPLKLLLDPMLILNGAGVDGDGPIIAQFTGGPTTGAESRFELKTQIGFWILEYELLPYEQNGLYEKSKWLKIYIMYIMKCIQIVISICTTM